MSLEESTGAKPKKSKKKKSGRVSGTDIAGTPSDQETSRAVTSPVIVPTIQLISEPEASEGPGLSPTHTFQGLSSERDIAPSKRRKGKSKTRKEGQLPGAADEGHTEVTALSMELLLLMMSPDRAEQRGGISINRNRSHPDF
nr:hypothetical protein BaRGS_010022 [Batillaria attramentaria]